MKKISIHVGGLKFSAELNDTETATTIFEALPFEGAAHVWGEEIYFDVPISLDQAPDAREEVAVGELAYWPTGSAFCIFFGPTPVSVDEHPRAYSPVNVFGRVNGDPALFKSVPAGAVVRVEKA